MGGCSFSVQRQRAVPLPRLGAEGHQVHHILLAAVTLKGVKVNWCSESTGWPSVTDVRTGPNRTEAAPNPLDCRLFFLQFCTQNSLARICSCAFPQFRSIPKSYVNNLCRKTILVCFQLMVHPSLPNTMATLVRSSRSMTNGSWTSERYISTFQSTIVEPNNF